MPTKPPPPGARRQKDGSHSWTRADGVAERDVPTYPLDQIKQVCRTLGVGAFHSGTSPGLTALGLTRSQALGVINGIDPACFHRSMTATRARTRDDHWQDVYHVPIPPAGVLAYVKFTPVIYAPSRSGLPPRPPHIVISFKPLDPKEDP